VIAMLNIRIQLPRRRRVAGQRGQVLLLVALSLAVLGGMTALAVDLASYIADRRDLHNDADAMAHAASLELPNASAATAAANEWAGKNGIEPQEIVSIEIIPQNLPSEPNPKVRVTLSREHAFIFAPLIGVSSDDVSTRAAAIKTSAAGGDNILPLSVTQADVSAATLGEEVVLKYDADDITTGNTNPIRIDGPGSGNCNASDAYCRGVKYGSQEAICADGADPTYCSGPTVVDTQPGNVTSGTRNGILYRLNNTDSRCDDFDEVFTDDDGSGSPDEDGDGIYRIVDECNPFLDGSYPSLRVVIVPVIEQTCNGSCQVTIVDFALFFIERIGSGGCTGNDCEVVGRFVRVNQNVGLLGGTFNPESLNSFVRLVE
jgi:hypothetical protein